MGGEIEGDRQALLAGGEVAPIEGVGVLRGGEAGILAHGPRLGDIHRGVGPAHIGRHAGIGVEEVEPLEVIRSVDPLYRNVFRREPRLRGAFRGGGRRLDESDRREIRDAGHDGVTSLVWPDRPGASPTFAGCIFGTAAPRTAPGTDLSVHFGRPSRSCAARSIASTSQPRKMKSSTPTPLSAASRSPARPAR